MLTANIFFIMILNANEIDPNLQNEISITEKTNDNQRFIGPPIYEDLELSFPMAKLYANCYPSCPKDPEFSVDKNIIPTIDTSISNETFNIGENIKTSLLTPISDDSWFSDESWSSDEFFNVYLNDEEHDEVDENMPPPTFRIPDSENINNDDPAVVCDDEITFCPGGTCCKMRSGKFGCCPYLGGTCCGNQVQCCPKGYECLNWPNGIRKAMHEMFGIPETTSEIRCRIDLSFYIKTLFAWGTAKKQFK